MKKGIDRFRVYILSLGLLFSGGYQIGKGFRFPDRHISEHFTVDFNPGLFQVVYKLTIFQTLGPARRINPQNPESSHVTFPLATVPVSITQ